MRKPPTPVYKAVTHPDAQSQSFGTAELPDEKVEAIAETKMDSRHDHINKLLVVK